jgi:hypothetical protein
MRAMFGLCGGFANKPFRASGAICLAIAAIEARVLGCVAAHRVDPCIIVKYKAVSSVSHRTIDAKAAHCGVKSMQVITGVVESCSKPLQSFC